MILSIAAYSQKDPLMAVTRPPLLKDILHTACPETTANDTPFIAAIQPILANPHDAAEATTVLLEARLDDSRKRDTLLGLLARAQPRTYHNIRYSEGPPAENLLAQFLAATIHAFRLWKGNTADDMLDSLLTYYTQADKLSDLPDHYPLWNRRVLELAIQAPQPELTADELIANIQQAFSTALHATVTPRQIYDALANLNLVNAYYTLAARWTQDVPDLQTEPLVAVLYHAVRPALEPDSDTALDAIIELWELLSDHPAPIQPFPYAPYTDIPLSLQQIATETERLLLSSGNLNWLKPIYDSATPSYSPDQLAHHIA